ncbi:MAG: T9SS C-terminal target domain-containing protein [Bacteroidetes bacterium]|nr:MAG: T9SS C-terminal target domain-containing protein [Bacteroidota bacterium]
MKNIFPQKLFPVIVFLLFMAQSAGAQTFVNPIPIPYLMTGDTFNLTVGTSSHNFNPNQPGDSINVALSTYCYNQTGNNQMTYLGPTLVWQKGQPIQINVTNDLIGHETTVHWHGLNLPAEMDGGPHEVIPSEGTWNPHFSVIDPIQTVWYHSHLMDSTTEQVIMGLAGMIILVDSTNDDLRALLPHDYGMNDFPIVIQEKGFNINTSVIPHIATSMIAQNNPGNGPFTMINGVLYGVLHVPPQMIRLRMLNGSPRKSFQVGVTPVLRNPNTASFDPMWLVATDGGYTAQPYPMDSSIISPGERMEFLVNFSTMNNGDTLYLSNLVRSIPLDIVSGGGNPPSHGTPGDAFFAFVVDTSIHPIAPIFIQPNTLLPYSVDTSDVFRHRTKTLNTGQFGGTWTIDNDTMDMGVINDTILVNKQEMWTIHNTTKIAHPFHIHKVQFQVVNYVDSLGNMTAYPNLPPYLMGFKDDVLIRAGVTLKFIAKFDSFPSMLDTMNCFMYHCHILTHEDKSMMHQFIVVDSATYYSNMNVFTITEISPFTLYPNPAGNLLNLKGASTVPVRLRFVDLLGHTLREEKISPFDGTISIHVEDLPRGMLFVEWTSGDNRFTKKILLK